MANYEPQTPQTQVIEQLDRTRVATEDASYHAIRVFNMLRDRLWEELALVNDCQTIEDIARRIQEMRLLLIRSNNAWLEIKHAVDTRQLELRAASKEFAYSNELEQYAAELKAPYELITNIKRLAAEQNEDALAYLQMPSYMKRAYLKTIIENIVKNADAKWGEYAAKINYTMPIELKENRDPFLS